MAEKRKYEVRIYSHHYGKVLFQDWTWAYSKGQAFKLIHKRLISSKDPNDMRALYYWGLDDLPRHAEDITDKEDKIKADKLRTKTNLDPETSRKYNTCPKCSHDTENDYCENCGWQRFANVKKAFSTETKNDNIYNQEEF